MLIKLYYISMIKKKLYLNNYKKMKFIANYIYLVFFKYLSCMILKNNYIYLFLKNNDIYKFFFLLKNNIYLNFVQLLDLIIMDNVETNKGKSFMYNYVILSNLLNISIFVVGFLNSWETLQSLSKLYDSSNWLESEAWDMFGIFFTGHTDLSSILTDYGFMGFPMRKDFPLSGYVELRYDEMQKSIVVEPLELTQEFSFFKLEVPWYNK